MKLTAQLPGSLSSRCVKVAAFQLPGSLAMNIIGFRADVQRGAMQAWYCVGPVTALLCINIFTYIQSYRAIMLQ